MPFKIIFSAVALITLFACKKKQPTKINSIESTSKQLITYHGNQNWPAYIQIPEKTETKAKGLILIHGTSGLTDNFINYNCQLFVDAGYAIVAPDLYLGKLPSNNTSSEFLQNALHSQKKSLVLAQIKSAYELLLSKADLNNLSIISWDQGSYWAIEASLSFPAIKSLVNYYGPPWNLKNTEFSALIPMLHIFTNKNPQVSLKDAVDMSRKIAKENYNFSYLVLDGTKAHFMDNPNNLHDKETSNTAYQKAISFLNKPKH